MKKYRATKIDTGSIMDELIEAPDLEEWARKKNPRGLFRTAHDLSPVDQANIALLHPGKSLTLELIEQYGRILGYPQGTIDALKTVFDAGDLAKVREVHMHAIDKQSKEWLDHISKDVNDELQKILGQKLNAPRAPVLRADPSPGNSAPGTPSSRFDAGLLGAVYNALNNAFGPQGSQFLSLQFPTRYLAKEEFQFDLNGVYSNFVKPVTVAEAEARLVDALYDPSPIVGGPNGKTLSIIYGQALNNLVPRYEPEDRPAREQRERMRAWLLTETGDQNPFYKLEVNTSTGGQVKDPNMSEAASKALLASNAVKMRKMTRMEFANQLTQGQLQTSDYVRQTDLCHLHVFPFFQTTSMRRPLGRWKEKASSTGP